MVVLRSLKDILSIKIKPRHDSPSDQFSRLLMTRLLLVSAFIMGYEYFSDRISCMKPHTSVIPDKYIHSACWISGFFVYKEIVEFDRKGDTIYYGIPNKFDRDGHFVPYWQNTYMIQRGGSDGKLCSSKEAEKNAEENIGYECQPLTRDYYFHYQWMPFYMGILAVFYYLPYIGYRLVNVDLISLKGVLGSVTVDADHIVRNYFNYKINSIGKLRVRVMLNILVKLSYVAVNLFAFFFTDYLLNGRYANYGFEYLDWARSNTDAKPHEIRRFRRKEKPGKFHISFRDLSDLMLKEYCHRKFLFDMLFPLKFYAK